MSWLKMTGGLRSAPEPIYRSKSRKWPLLRFALTCYGYAFAGSMLQNNSVYFQWATLTPGSSTRHNCNMEATSADISERLGSMRVKIRDVWSQSGVVGDFARNCQAKSVSAIIPVADLLAMQLALLEPPAAETSGSPTPNGVGGGREGKHLFEAAPAKQTRPRRRRSSIMHIEEITGELRSTAAGRAT